MATGTTSKGHPFCANVQKSRHPDVTFLLYQIWKRYISPSHATVISLPPRKKEKGGNKILASYIIKKFKLMVLKQSLREQKHLNQVEGYQDKKTVTIPGDQESRQKTAEQHLGTKRFWCKTMIQQVFKEI